MQPARRRLSWAKTVFIAVVVTGAASEVVGQTLSLPTQDQVFTVDANYCRHDGPYFSSDDFFSALFSLRTVTEVPSKRDAVMQHRVVVSKDR